MRQFSRICASDLTTMHCGGKIAVLFEPESPQQLRELIGRLEDFVVLGGGSNLIFEDTLITRPVIRLGRGFNTIQRTGDHLAAGAALSTGALLSSCVDNGLSGLEFIAGIPGTVGGALWMNAGTSTSGIMNAVESVEVMDREGIHTLAREAIPYGYRHGGIPTQSVILGARFALNSAPRDRIQETIASFLEKRRSQPRGYSCGSVFRNPAGSAAGLLIEQAGMKGFSIGGAKVSDIHANFIINDGNASTSDIKVLIDTVKQRVREKFGIELVEEVRIIG